MDEKYIYAESTVKPSKVMIGKKIVYLRKDISEELRTDEQGNNTMFYVYKEAKITPEEFNKRLRSGEASISVLD